MAAGDPELLALKTPPHSAEAEQSLLGGLLLDNAAYERVSDLVSAEDFYRDDHRRIYLHISRLIEASKPADVVTVGDSIEASEDKDRAGGLAYLGALAQNTPSALNIRRYAELVWERAIQRRLAQAATDIAEIALRPTQDVMRMVDDAESRVLGIGERTTRRNGAMAIDGLLARAFERIDDLHRRVNKSDVTGVPSGFIDLDEITAGFHPGDLIIVAGRPSMGKTALALNIAEHVAVDNGIPAAIFSMEMSGTQLANRLLGSRGHVDQQKMRTGKLTDDDWGRLSGAVEKLHGAQIEVDETGGLTAFEVRARARRMRRRMGKLGLVVVDYIQLMEAREGGENRATDIGEITRGLKAMAKELECPVIALSQLNRKVEDRMDKRPHMSDLRESGAIEQDADTILFLYRPEVYYPDNPEFRGIAEVIVGKQRNGPIGYVKLAFLGEYTRFENLARDGSFR